MVVRVLSLMIAVGMVAGALVARGRLDESDERTRITLRLVCATELAAVCDALAGAKGSKVEATVEPAATTADSLTKLAPGKRPPLDGWLVTAPWPAIVNEARARSSDSAILTPGPVLGRSPVVLAVRAGRNPSLVAACNGPPGWKCLGDVAGRQWSDLPNGSATWGVVKPGHSSATSAAGLTVVGGALAAYFDSKPDLSSADLDDEAFQSWLDRLEKAVPARPASPFQIMLQRPTAFDAVGTLESDAGPLMLTARAPKPVLLYPSPVVTADVVLGVAGGRAADLLADLVSGKTGREALANAGWRVDGAKRSPGIAAMALPPTSNLPDPGVLDALRSRIPG